MALDIMGLFNTQSVNPYQQQQQAFQQNLMQSTNPQQFAATVGSNMGGQLAGAVPGLFGMQSEEDKKNKAKQDALAEVQSLNIDPTDKNAVGKALVMALQRRGLNMEAMQVGQSLEDPAKEAGYKPASDIGKLMADQARFTEGSAQWTAYQKAIDKATKDKEAGYKPESVIGKLMADQERFAKGSAQWKAYQKAIDKATEDKEASQPSVGTDAELEAQALYGKSFNTLTLEQKQTVATALREKKGVSTGEGLTALAKSLVDSSGKQLGKDVAESVAPVVIQGKEDTLSSLKRAKKLLNEGIYTGGLADLKKGISKYTPLGSQKKLENTEKYISYVSTTVIPLLKEFGGNDSNEELKFLQRLTGGDTTMEESTLKEVIDSAIIKVQRSIERTSQNVKNISKGEMPDTLVQPQKFGNSSESNPVNVGKTIVVNGVPVTRVK